MVKRRYAGCPGFGSGCRRGILAALLSLTVCLVAACGSADAPPGAGSPAGPASTGSRSDASLVPPATASETAAESAADEPGVQQITLYYSGYRDESPQFDRLNALLKEKGHPWRIRAVNYYPEVRSGLARYQREFDPAPPLGYTTKAIRKRLEDEGLYGDRTWQGCREVRRYLEQLRNEDVPADVIILNNNGYTPISEPAHVYAGLGLIQPLDDWLKTDAGQAVSSAFPEMAWQGLMRDGYLYGLPGGIQDRFVAQPYYWVNGKLAEQYGIDISDWGADFWNHRDEMIRVWTGEHEKGPFQLILWSSFAGEIFPHMTAAGYLPVVFDENQGVFKSLYADGGYRDFVGTCRDFQEAGYLPQNWDQLWDTPDCFFLRWPHPEWRNWSDFVAVGPIADHYRDDFESIVTFPSWSRQTDAALELMRAVYTDPELSAAMISGDLKWDPAAGILSPYYVLGNPYWHEAVRSWAEREAEERPRSGLYGRALDLSEHLDAVDALFRFKTRQSADHQMLGSPNYDPEQLLEEMRAAGLDEVVDALNGQLP